MIISSKAIIFIIIGKQILLEIIDEIVAITRVQQWKVMPLESSPSFLQTLVFSKMKIPF